MANVFKPKRSSTASSVPTTSDLADGELAVNSADQKIYLRDGASVVEVGNVAAGGGGISDIVEDTTPQLGGNLSSNGKNINFGDSASASDDRLNFGAGTDFSIYHDGSNSYIDVDPDAVHHHLYIRNNVTTDYGGDIVIQAKSGENSIRCYDDTSVELYYDNSVKLTTTSTGFSVTGTGLGNWKAGDSQYLIAGAGDDLKIYHDGTNSYIDVDPDATNQHLYIRNNVTTDHGGNIYLQAKSGENSIICFDDTSVVLYYDNAQKFTTTSTGFTVSGTGLGNFKAGDNQYLTAGAGDDFQIYHDETNTYLDNDTGHLYIRNNVASDVGGNIYLRPHDNEEGIIIYDDGGVYLYYDNALKLYTTSAGVTISGTLSVTTLAFGDSQTMTFGAGDDLKIYHDGSNSYIDVDPDADNQHLYIRNNVTTDYGGNIYIQAKSGENSIVCNDDTSVALYYDNAQKFYTSSTGVTVSGTGLGNWKAGDSQYLTAGAGDDFQIYHDGTNTYLDNDTGHVYIRNNVAGDVGSNIYIQAKSGENSIVCNDDTSVILYYDNAQKFYTTSTGATVVGTLSVTTLAFGDNQTMTFGASDDLSIYHYYDSVNDISVSYIDNDTGDLYIRNNVGGDVGADIYIQSKSGENSIACFDDSSVRLYFDGAQKFTTTSTGFTVSGTGLGNFKAGDSQYLTAGAGDDLQIYHDGTDTYFDNDTGSVYIRNNVATDVGGDIYIQAKSGENSIACFDDSSTRLYFDGVQKLTTTSTGVTISGTLSVTTLAFSDDQTMTFGASDDLSIYHNGTDNNSYIDNDTGSVYIRNNVATDVGGDIYIQAKSGENSIACFDDSSTRLYFDGAQKLTTSSTGVTVSGTGVGNWKANDSAYITAGTGDDLQIYHDGTDTYFDNDTGSVYIRNNVATDVNGDIYIQAKSGENSIACFDDSSTRLYFDGAQKLTTSSTGITVSGTGLGNWKAGDSQYLTAGAGDDFQIYHDGTNTYLDNDTGHLYIRNNVAGDVGGNIYLMPHDNENGIIIHDDGEVQIYYDNAEKLNTSSTGVTVTGALTATTIVKSGGTSSEFLKADGSVDTSTYLTSSGDGSSLTGVLSDVVEDTTPQLGGNLDLNTNDITGTGNIDITGTLEVSGISTFSNEISIVRPDSAIYSYRFLDFIAGTGAADRVGSISIYDTVFTLAAQNCDLHLSGYQNSDTVITTTGVNGSYSGSVGRTAVFTSDGIAQLWYQDVKKFETTGGGVNVIGHTETDTLNVSGIATASEAKIGAAAPNSSLTTIGVSGINVSGGIVTATSFSGSGSSLTGLTGASSGTYGDASNVAAITVDDNGRITGITEVAISGGGGGGASEAFKTISVSGQSDVVADSATDTLTLVAGSNMTITTNASGDSITFASSGGGGGGGGITRAQSMISAMVFS